MLQFSWLSDQRASYPESCAELRPEPAKMSLAGRIKADAEATVLVIRIVGRVRLVDVVSNRPVAVEKAAHHIQKELRGHPEAPHRKALLRRQTNRRQPVIQFDIAEVHAVGAARFADPRANAVHAPQERVDELEIFRHERDVPPTAKEATVRRDEPDRVGEIIAPNKSSFPNSGPPDSWRRDRDLSEVAPKIFRHMCIFEENAVRVLSSKVSIPVVILCDKTSQGQRYPHRGSFVVAVALERERAGVRLGDDARDVEADAHPGKAVRPSCAADKGVTELRYLFGRYSDALV